MATDAGGPILDGVASGRRVTAHAYVSLMCVSKCQRDPCVPNPAFALITGGGLNVGHEPCPGGRAGVVAARVAGCFSPPAGARKKQGSAEFGFNITRKRVLDGSSNKTFLG
ncbi:hypothetical_protein_-_conserved [Leishmania major strain Friedlin]|nr:hypothetical_protein_-_conserved [Leishmania major strain Friedlin]